jgi:hypothetical protein
MIGESENKIRRPLEIKMESKVIYVVVREPTLFSFQRIENLYEEELR